MQSKAHTKPLVNLAVAAACGAVAMYFLDPLAGRRRRAYVRDKAVAGRHDVADLATKRAKRARDQTRGIIAKLRAGWRHDDASDPQVAERVRSALGRIISRPREIDVLVEDGHAQLTGHVRDSERRAVVEGVANVRGVRAVEDRLSTRERTDDGMRPGGGIGSAP